MTHFNGAPFNQFVLKDLRDHLQQKKVICRYCGSSVNIIKKGFRKNDSDDKQRYKCKYCRKRFVDEITRHSNQDLWVHDFVLDLVVNNVKPSAISKLITKLSRERGQELVLSKTTILKMIKKDCQFLSTFEYHLCHPIVSRVWEIDETFDRIKNRERCHVFNVKTIDTKYWLVSYATMEKEQLAQEIALTIACNRAGYAPDIIRSDGFSPKIEKCIKPFENAKIVSIPKKENYACINNVERTNCTMRELIKKGYCSYSLENLQSLVELKRLHHNFLRDHPSYSYSTPAKIAGLDLPIKSWIDLFRIADYFDRKVVH